MKKILALFVAVVLCFCAWPAFASDASPIKIGVIAPLTGPVAVYGTATANGILLYAKVINAAGGLNGHPV
ncbi:MAG: ABC transporter substrate-binding protein, partial [Synergistaceae bacterium]|nr:ABC transporter substrate-binding protein [Synergistaceae bacterium]